MVVSSRPSHSSRVNVVGHDVAIVSERHLTDGAVPVLFDNLAVEQLPHLCFGAEFAVSPGVVRVFDTLHSQASDSASLLDQLAATARNGSVNGAEFIATKFHELSPAWVFREKRKMFDFLCACEPIAIPFDPLHDSAVP
jgi:hypothetical protein